MGNIPIKIEFPSGEMRKRDAFYPRKSRFPRRRYGAGYHKIMSPQIPAVVDSRKDPIRLLRHEMSQPNPSAIGRSPMHRKAPLAAFFDRERLIGGDTVPYLRHLFGRSNDPHFIKIFLSESSKGFQTVGMDTIVISQKCDHGKRALLEGERELISEG